MSINESVKETCQTHVYPKNTSQNKHATASSKNNKQNPKQPAKQKNKSFSSPANSKTPPQESG